MIKRIPVLAAILLLLLTILCPASDKISAQSQNMIAMSNSVAQIDFPLALHFSAQFQSNTDITDIRLRYKVERLGYAQVINEAYVNFTPSSTINARYTLDMRRIGGFPPGANLHYWWVAEDAGGATLETEPVQYQINDTRYKWQSLSQDKINIFWYEGSNSFAQALMSTAQQSLVKLASDTGATPDNIINVYIYANYQDLQGSMVYPQEWTGGVAFTQYNIIAIGINTNNLSWGQRAMTHELTHNVVNQETYNPYNEIPVWLNEGMAMYSEGDLTPQFSTPLVRAIQTDNLFSVRSISSPFSAYADKANLAYAQSYSLVDYLIKQHGSDKMLELFNTFKQGSAYDMAFQKVYGFNMDGLNVQWKSRVTSQYGK
jgi:hypothetical protein